MPSLTGNTTVSQLERHLRGTPLAGTGRAFVQAGRRYGVDPRLLVSIASAESSLGRYAQGHNPFGWGPGIHFNSWGQAIDTVARGLSENYLGQGLKTIEQIGAKYAPQQVANDPTGLNSNWVKNVKAMYRQLGGKGITGAPAVTGTPASTAVGPDLRAFVGRQMGGNPEQGGRPYKPTETLDNLVQLIRSTPAAVSGQPQETETAGPGEIRVRAGADRSGVHTNAAVLAFAREVAGIYGHPLTIGTGTNHNRMTVNGNVSDHWDGNAVDIPLTGSALLRAGRAALIAAGMPRAKAMKAKGGLYNVGGHQVIFLTRQGGNHFNHLHISAH